MNTLNIVARAISIAKENLRSNYDELGIKTGSLRNTYWSWDSFFASFGALKLGDKEIVKKNIESFLDNINNEGVIPRRISAPLLFYHLNFIKKINTKKMAPSYSVCPGFKKPIFQNLVFFIALANYVKKTKDFQFIRKNYDKLHLVLQAILKRCDKNNLISEGYFENWTETILKRGNVLFTNVLFYKALCDISFLMQSISKKKESLELKSLSSKVRKQINKKFWLGNYYADWIYKNKINKTFSADGNIAAIIYDVADKNKSVKIQENIEKFNLSEPVPMKTNWPRYKLNEIYPLNWLVLKEYHNGVGWLWLGCMDCVAKHKIGMKKEAQTQLVKIAETIVKYNTVAEIYDNDGKPYSSLFYKAETKFSWSAGLFIWAVNLIHNRY